MVKFIEFSAERVKMENRSFSLNTLYLFCGGLVLVDKNCKSLDRERQSVEWMEMEFPEFGEMHF